MFWILDAKTFESKEKMYEKLCGGVRVFQDLYGLEDAIKKGETAEKVAICDGYSIEGSENHVRMDSNKQVDTIKLVDEWFYKYQQGKPKPELFVYTMGDALFEYQIWEDATIRDKCNSAEPKIKYFDKNTPIRDVNSMKSYLIKCYGEPEVDGLAILKKTLSEKGRLSEGSPPATGTETISLDDKPFPN